MSFKGAVASTPYLTSAWAIKLLCEAITSTVLSTSLSFEQTPLAYEKSLYAKVMAPANIFA